MVSQSSAATGVWATTRAGATGARLSRHAATLPAVLQKVLIMRFVAGASLRQIAEHFGVDRAQARAWEREAVAQLGATATDRRPEVA